MLEGPVGVPQNAALEPCVKKAQRPLPVTEQQEESAAASLNQGGTTDTSVFVPMWEEGCFFTAKKKGDYNYAVDWVKRTQGKVPQFF